MTNTGHKQFSRPFEFWLDQTMNSSNIYLCLWVSVSVQYAVWLVCCQSLCDCVVYVVFSVSGNYLATVSYPKWNCRGSKSTKMWEPINNNTLYTNTWKCLLLMWWEWLYLYICIVWLFNRFSLIYLYINDHYHYYFFHIFFWFDSVWFGVVSN